MSSTIHLRSVGRFLYSQNPFYLISCFLVLYGLQSHADSGTDIAERSATLAAWIAGYTALMAVMVIAATRVFRVWQDARSIFLVVIIGFVSLSWSIDEWYVIGDLRATGVMFASFVLSIILSEIVVWACGMRFSWWYRLSYYGLLLMFFTVPAWLGYLVSIRNRSITPWSGLIFSAAIACATLLLIPAVRRGTLLTRRNGTPWKWPLYPMSAFVILWVMAGMRSHAVWTAFAINGPDVRFEPLLILPIAWSMLILLAESNLGRRREFAAPLSMLLAPALLFLGLTLSKHSHLPFHDDLVHWTGSTITVALFSIHAFYVYMRFRGARAATPGIIATLVATSVIGTVPVPLEQVGLQLWMIAAGAAVLQFAWTLRRADSSLAWTALGATLTLAIYMGLLAHNMGHWTSLVPVGFAISAAMLIGALFDSELATFLRWAAATCLAVASALVVIGSFQWSIDRSLVASATALLVSIGYVIWVKRFGWFYIVAWNFASLLFITSYSAYIAGFFERLNLPFQTGVVFLVVAVGITTLKSERLGIAQFTRRERQRFSQWDIGF